MRIPKNTVKPRFYVVTSNATIDRRALSSWSSHDDALSCIQRWKQKAEEEPHYYKKGYTSIIGIIETGPGEQVFHKTNAIG